MMGIRGYRTDWIAFAPDFQALQQNICEEKEDEFDVVADDGNEEINTTLYLLKGFLSFC